MTETSVTARTLENELARQLQKKDYIICCLLSMRNGGNSYVLAMRDSRRLLICCRRYDEAIDPEYLAAFERAINRGKIGSRWVLTFDGERDSYHQYTLHIAPNMGPVSQLAAAIRQMSAKK